MTTRTLMLLAGVGGLCWYVAWRAAGLTDVALVTGAAAIGLVVGWMFPRLEP